MSLLAGLDQLIADVAGPLLFEGAVIYYDASGSIDANGQFVSTGTAQACKALESDYSAFHRASLSIPDTHRKILVLGYGLDQVPKPGDKIDLGGVRWEIIQAKRDPARAVYSCQSKPIGEAVTIRYATHSGRLVRTMLIAEASVSAVYAPSPMARLTGSAFAEALISAQHNGTLRRMSDSALAEVINGAVHSGILSRLDGAALAEAITSATHNGTLSRLLSSSEAGIVSTATHAGMLARTMLDAGATIGAFREAIHAGVLAKLAGTGAAEAVISAQSAGILARLSGMANAGAGVDAESVSALARLMGSATAQTLVSGQSEVILARLAGASIATVSVFTSHAGALARVTGTAEAANLASASHAGTLGRITGIATAEVAPPASSYEPETDAYIAAMTVAPPTARQDAIDAFIASIKTAGVVAHLDFLYVAGHNEQASGLNVISPGTGTDLVRGHADLIFTPDSHWEYHPSGHSWDTGFDASTAGGNWTVTDVSYGFYIVQMGDDARISDKANLRINTNQDTRVYFELNAGWQGALIETASYTVPGLYSAVRNTGTPDQISTYFNGTFNNNSGPPDAASALPTGTIKMFEGTNGAPVAPFPRLGLYYGGGGLTATELADLATAVETLRASYI